MTGETGAAGRARAHTGRVIVRGRPRRIVAALLAALLLGAGLTALVAVRAGGSDTTHCQRNRADAAHRARAVTGSGTPVAVIGDSWSVGLGLERLADSWPARLPGRVTVAGFSGSGFSRFASRCGDHSFAQRANTARAAGGLVVVEGGLNDYDQPDAALVRGFDRLLGALGGVPVVVVGPATAPARAVAVRRVDELLASLCAARGVPYVRTSGWRLPYLPDGLHLTAAGHRLFGDEVAAELAALGLLGCGRGDRVVSATRCRASRW